MRYLIQTARQACLALTIKALATDISFVSGPQIQDSRDVVEPVKPLISSGCCSITSEVEAARAAGLRDAALVLIIKRKVVLLDWISVKNSWCALRLQGLVGIRKDSCANSSLFVIAAYVEIKHSTDIFHDAFTAVFWKAKGFDIVVGTGDFNSTLKN